MKIFHTLLFFFAALFLFPVVANAQEEASSPVYTFRGKVVDARGNEIPSAQIRKKDDSNKLLALTDLEGCFEVRLPKPCKVEIRSLGFEPKWVQLKKDEEIQVVLKEEGDTELLGVATVRGAFLQRPRIRKSKMLRTSNSFWFSPSLTLPKNMRIPRKAKQYVISSVVEDYTCQKKVYECARTFPKKKVKAFRKEITTIAFADTFKVDEGCRDHERVCLLCTHFEDGKGRIIGTPDTTCVAYGQFDPTRWLEIPQKAYHLKDSVRFVPRAQEAEVVTRYADGREEVSKVALSDKDVRQWYNDESKRKDLMAYEWYRLVVSENDLAKKEQYCREANQKYPGVWLFANELQCILIERGTSDPKLLFPYVEQIKAKHRTRGYSGNKPYFPFIQNHITACLMNHELDSIAANVAYLEKNEDTELTIATWDALAGYYKDALPTFQKVCPRNEFVLCMALSEELEEGEDARMQYAQRALELALAMPEEQVLTHYFRAMAWFRQLNSIQDDDIANDVNHYVEKAEKEIKKAFEMDPSLKKAAIGDAMVNRIPYVQGLLNDYIHARGGQ